MVPADSATVSMMPDGGGTLTSETGHSNNSFLDHCLIETDEVDFGTGNFTGLPTHTGPLTARVQLNRRTVFDEVGEASVIRGQRRRALTARCVLFLQSV